MLVAVPLGCLAKASPLGLERGVASGSTVTCGFCMGRKLSRAGQSPWDVKAMRGLPRRIALWRTAAMSIFSQSPRLREGARVAARWLAPVQPRRGLVGLGKHMSVRQLERLRVTLGAIEQGQWFSTVQHKVPNKADRFALFTEALRRIRGAHPLYLEFGVFQGRTLRWWSNYLTAPTARFVGFDSFEGLPEQWQSDAPAGSFNADGPPIIPDPRVSFVTGWFDETLPGWEPPEHDQLIVNIDCDLYSSTTVVLTWLASRLRPGSLVYFDDLLDRDHELRALQEWLCTPGNRAVPVATARWGQHMLFEWQ
jgi:hypothetical protein